MWRSWGGTATSREALEDKTRRRRRGGGGGRERGCVPPKPVSSLLLSRGLSREPCPKSLAPGGRLSIVKRWPLQAGPPAATAAASCPPPPPAHTHTHTQTHTSSQYPLHLQHHDNAPCGQGHRPVESIKKDLEETLEKGHSGPTCFLAEH